MEVLEERMKKLETNQAEILDRMDKIEKQFANLELKNLKESLLNEVEQELELQRIRKGFAVVEQECHILQTVNEDLVDVMMKLKETTDAQIEDLKSELNAFKDSVNDMQVIVSKSRSAVARSEPKKIEFYQAKPSTLQRKVLNLKPDLVWKISDIRRMMCQGVENSCKSFTLTGYPFWALARFFSDQENFSLIFYLDPDQLVSEEMLPKIVPRVHLLLKDQSGNKETQDLVRSGCCTFGSSSRFMPFVLSKSIILNPAYVADDALTMEIHVEQPHVANRVQSRNGCLTFTVFSYRRCKELERKGLMLYQLSPYFYTAPRGYRVQAAVYLNGGGTNKDRGLSVGISFQTGEFDQELSLNFPHVTTLTVVDPLDPLNFITGHVSNDIRGSNASYIINLWGHEVIEKFVVEDSFTLKVVVEPK